MEGERKKKGRINEVERKEIGFNLGYYSTRKLAWLFTTKFACVSEVRYMCTVYTKSIHDWSDGPRRIVRIRL